MKSYLEESLGGIYTPGLRFAFSNITEEDFTSYWSKVPIVVKAGETIELSDATPMPGMGMGQTLAIKMTGELVDKIMLQGIKVRENEYYKTNPGALPNAFRAPNSVGVPAARKPLEDQILRPLAVDEESPAMQLLRQQVIAEIESGKDGKAENVPIPTTIEEFAELKISNLKSPEAKPVRTKKIS